MLQSFIEEFTIAFFFHQRQQGAKRGFNIAHQRHVDFAVRANTARVDVNLNDFGIARIKGAVGELGAEQDQRIGVHHGVEARREANQAGHSHIIRVIVLNVLFAAQGMNDWRF